MMTKTNNIKVLIGCEKSQVVCIEFRKLGFEAYSNDLLDCCGGHPEWHLKMDVFDAIKSKLWDLIIMHPTCKKLAVSGNSTYSFGKPKHHERLEAIEWTTKLFNYAAQQCDKICLENPVGVLGSNWIYPSPQYIHPWQFGHRESKKTGLWLHNLPKLIPTNILPLPECGYWDNQDKNRQNKILVDGRWLGFNDPRTEDIRSKTYQGIAEAMAKQWGELLIKELKYNILA